MGGIECFVFSSVNSADVSELGKIIVGEIFVFVLSPAGGLFNPHKSRSIYGNFRYIAAVKVLLQSFLELDANRQVFFNGRTHKDFSISLLVRVLEKLQKVKGEKHLHFSLKRRSKLPLLFVSCSPDCVIC